MESSFLIFYTAIRQIVSTIGIHNKSLAYELIIVGSWIWSKCFVANKHKNKVRREYRTL